MNYIIRRTELVLITLLVWGIFAYLFLTGSNPYQLENIFGLLTLTIFPGMFIVLALRLRTIPAFVSAALSVAFSLLGLMIVAVLGNYLLPKFGVTAPLHPLFLFIETSIFLFTTLIISWFRISDWSTTLANWKNDVFPTLRDLWTAFVPLIFVVQAIMGAFVLNNGGANTLILSLLAEIAVWLVFLVVNSKDLHENTIAITLSYISLSLLLMTSMRGWFITGHDIQREFQVFMLAKETGIWSMAAYRDAYNACLSITILPTIFSNLLHFNDVYVFKFVFQFFFAIVPGLVYFINRNWVKKEYAILATIYFFCFPTFFTDMPFLIRQEIAFLFYGLMLFVLFCKSIDITKRRILFMILGLGVVLSHYSTTYTVIVVMAMTIVFRPFFIRILLRFSRRNKLQQSSLVDAVSIELSYGKKYLTFWMVAVFALTSFLWTGIVTKTSNSVTRVVNETVIAIQNGFMESSRSVDVVNLISFNAPNQQEQLDEYIKTSILSTRQESPLGTYYDAELYQQYAYTALQDERLPKTALAHVIDVFGINSSSIIGIIGQLVAKLMEVMALVGLLYVFFRRRFINGINTEIYLLAFSSFVFVAMNMILPILSTEYGIYRALLQSLFIVGFLIVVATVAVGNSIAELPSRIYSYFMMTDVVKRKEGTVFPLTIAILFFIYGSGLAPQLFGGNTPLLHLNNSGRYYDTYLIRGTGNSATYWLSHYVRDSNGVVKQGTSLEIDHSSVNQFTAMGDGLIFHDGIFPGEIRKDAYVFVTAPTFQKGRSTILYHGDQITYSYPIEFLDQNKDLLYDNGETRIYH